MWAIREVPANEKSLKLNETLEILFCGNCATLLGENIHTFWEGNGRWASLVASKEFSSKRTGKI
jgi:hypothetical protein